jgi:SAM-dependent methyltransferase
MLGKFDADTTALRRRERLNGALAARNLEDWIVDRVHPRAGERVLDIGCGTGKQIFDLAQRIGGLDILGIDISGDAIAAIRRRARDEAVPGIAARQMGIDDCVERLAPVAFDLILSTYAIYYSRDLGGTVKRLAQLLRPGGRAFLSGPGVGTNRELIAILRAVASDAGVVADIDDFISAGRIEAARRYWGAVELYRLDNEITFPSVDEVLGWWRNHNSYQPELENGVAASLAQVVARDGSFRLTKNVLGILLKRT